MFHPGNSYGIDEQILPSRRHSASLLIVLSTVPICLRTVRGRFVFPTRPPRSWGGLNPEILPMSNLSVNTSIQTRFLALLPRIEIYAKIYFRDVLSPSTKADCVAECTAVAWKWFLRLHERGKDISNFPIVFVFYVAKAVRSGRRVCG